MKPAWCGIHLAGLWPEQGLQPVTGATAFQAVGFTPEVREDHASYIATWLTVLKNDNRAIFQAAAHAQRAVDFLHKLQPEPMEAAA